jgi:hypothetical protein
MLKSLTLFVLLTTFVMSIPTQAETKSKEPVKMQKSIYDFKMKDIDGKDVSLNSYKGKVVMVVNVASKCKRFIKNIRIRDL